MCPTPCLDPPEPQLLMMKSPKASLPPPGQQTWAEEAPYPTAHIHDALATATIYLGSRWGWLCGMRPWLGQGVGDAGLLAASLGVVGKAPPGRKHGGASSPSQRSLSASSCPVRRDLPPEQRSEVKATVLTATGIAAQPFSVQLHPGEQDTPLLPPSQETSISPWCQPSAVAGPWPTPVLQPSEVVLPEV